MARSSHPARYGNSLRTSLTSRLDLGQHASPQQATDRTDHEPVGQEAPPDMRSGAQDMCLRDKARPFRRGWHCHKGQDQGCSGRIPVTEKLHGCVKTAQAVIRLPESAFQPVDQTAIGLGKKREVLKVQRQRRARAQQAGGQFTQVKGRTEERIITQAVVPHGVQDGAGPSADQDGMMFGKIERFYGGVGGFRTHGQKFLSAGVMP